MKTINGAAALCLALGALGSCGPRSYSADQDAGVIEGIDTSAAGLLSFARSGAYRSWASEPAVHRSTGPHRGRVRTFFNDRLRDSFAANNTTHPRGSVAVKELFEDDGTTLYGYAIDVKIVDGSGKDTWLFYEGFGPDYRDPYYGIGHNTCHGCHSGGVDYMLSRP